MNYKNPISRFILRKNWLRRVHMRLTNYQRKLSKSLLNDISILFDTNKVSVIFDIGANVGFVTYQFRSKFPHARIYSFEPNATVFAQLQENYKNDKNVEVFPHAVGDGNETRLFTVNANTGTSSFLAPSEYHLSHQARKLGEPIAVNVITIDNFVEREGIHRIQILKMDIEGYELKALMGASHLLKHHLIDCIYTEVNIVRSYVGQPLFHELTTFLEGYDYHLYNLDDFIAQETPIRQAVIGNALYISGSHRASLEKRYGVSNCGW